MPLISGGGSGSSFNGGRVTNPIVVDLSADLGDRTAFEVIEPAGFGFSVDAFSFTGGGATLLALSSNGNLTTEAEIVATGGPITALGNVTRVTTALGVVVHDLGPAALGFFGSNPDAQHAAIPDAAGGAVQDAEARAALNSLLTAVRTLGLVAA